MPENETLLHNSGRASRWRSLCDKLDGGQSPAEAFPEIQDQFYSCLRRVWRQWKRHGVDPGQLFEAAQADPGRLIEMIRQTRFDSYARLVRDVSVGSQVLSREDIVRDFLDSAWDAARNELRLDCREIDHCPEFPGWVEAMLERMLRGLLKNPGRFPSRPPRKDPPPDLDTKLGENLR